jgi:hypothetical protein
MLVAIFGVSASTFRPEHGVIHVQRGDSFPGSWDDLSTLSLFVVPPRQNYGIVVENWNRRPTPAGLVLLHGWTLSMADYQHFQKSAYPRRPGS